MPRLFFLCCKFLLWFVFLLDPFYSAWFSNQWFYTLDGIMFAVRRIYNYLNVIWVFRFLSRSIACWQHCVTSIIQYRPLFILRFLFKVFGLWLFFSSFSVLLVWKFYDQVQNFIFIVFPTLSLKEKKNLLPSSITMRRWCIILFNTFIL